MSGQFGYNQLFTDRPETWVADGYISVTADGYTLPTVPSGIVSAITRNSTGNFSLTLVQNWFALLDAAIRTEIPAALSPAFLFTQLDSDTVGVASSGQTITFRLIDGSGVATDPPLGSGIRFTLLLKKSSA